MHDKYKRFEYFCLGMNSDDIIIYCMFGVVSLQLQTGYLYAIWFSSWRTSVTSWKWVITPQLTETPTIIVYQQRPMIVRLAYLYFVKDEYRRKSN